VRDTVYGAGGIADVDLVVACPRTELINHLRSYLKRIGASEDQIQESVKQLAFGCLKVGRVRGDGDELDVAEFKGLRVFYDPPPPPDTHWAHYTHGFSFAWDYRSRDFTVNALYFSMSGEFFDPTGRGFDDAQGRVARFACPTELPWDLGGCFRLWKMALKKKKKKGGEDPSLPMYTVSETSFWMALTKLADDLTRFRGELDDRKLEPATRETLDKALGDLRAAVGASGVDVPGGHRLGGAVTFDLWYTKLQGKLFRDKVRYSALAAQITELDGAFRHHAAEALHGANRLLWRCVRYMCRGRKESELLTSDSPAHVIMALAAWTRVAKAPAVDLTWIPDHLVVKVKSDDGNVEVLGEGSFGKVVLGRYNKQDVAIKAINVEGGMTKDEAATLKEEARRLTAVEHENVVACYGVLRLELAIVMEAAPPSLAEVVRGATYGTHLTDGQLFLAALQIARGMREVQRSKMMHCDLRAANVLVGPRGPSRRCRITDFGLSRMMVTSHTILGTMKAEEGAGGADGGVHAREVYWVAPEVYEYGYDELSEKSDVFSYGIVLYEMISGGRVPFLGVIEKKQVFENYKNADYGSLIEKAWPKEYGALILRCIHPEKQKRPTFAQVVDDIERLGVADEHLELV